MFTKPTNKYSLEVVDKTSKMQWVVINSGCFGWWLIFPQLSKPTIKQQRTLRQPQKWTEHSTRVEKQANNAAHNRNGTFCHFGASEEPEEALYLLTYLLQHEHFTWSIVASRHLTQRQSSFCTASVHFEPGLV